MTSLPEEASQHADVIFLDGEESFPRFLKDFKKENLMLRKYIFQKQDHF